MKDNFCRLNAVLSYKKRCIINLDKKKDCLRISSALELQKNKKRYDLKNLDEIKIFDIFSYVIPHMPKKNLKTFIFYYNSEHCEEGD